MSTLFNSKTKPFYSEFSNAMDSFYDSKVVEITTFKSTNTYVGNFYFTAYHVDFMLENGLPGLAHMVCVIQDNPIYEINIMPEDKIYYLLGHEFEIIRPHKVNSMSDMVNRYRTLLELYLKYRSGEISHHTNQVYLDLLIMYIRLFQNSIEDIAVIAIDKKKLIKGGGVEGLIKLDVSKRFPIIEKKKNENIIKNEHIINNIIFN